MYKVGLENNTEGRSQAWILGHPGCFAYGADGPEALAAVPEAIQDYSQWVSSHTRDSWLPAGEIQFSLDETWDCYSIDENYELAQAGYEVNAWFRNDWLPLGTEDIQHGMLLLGWGREALMQLVSSLDISILERTYTNERWSIAGILNHIGGAEWWYLDRLGMAFPRAEVPELPFDRLLKVRERLLEVLPNLAGKKQVVGVAGEFWSPRKLLRRAVWHEYDHTDHIRKLL
jgi:DinB superfamily